MNGQRLTEKDVDAILTRAVREQGPSTEDVRTRMRASAAELGIAPEELEAAEQAHFEEAQRAEQQKQARKEQWASFLDIAWPIAGLVAIGALMLFTRGKIPTWIMIIAALVLIKRLAHGKAWS